MDPRLLDYYNRELRYLRELGGEFARDFPKVAGRLGLDAFECADPYVERLLEGFAFLAARAQLKIDAEFPRFTEHLLEMLCPHYLGPTPSMAVVQLRPDPQQAALNDGFVLPRGSSLLGNVRKGEATACEYRTAHPVTLWPLELTEVAHSAYAGELGDLRGGGGTAPVKGVLRIRLRTTNGAPFSLLGIDDLALFVRGSDPISLRLFELFHCASAAVFVRDPDVGTAQRVAGASVGPLGMEDSHALLPRGARGFDGYRLLHEYFALPTRFLFVRLAGLKAGLRSCAGREVEVVLALDRHEPSLEPALTTSHLALFCAPAINLFPRTADRIHLSDRENEYHVVADRTRPMDFEVHSVSGVTGFGTRNDVRREFFPFYSSRADRHGDDATFFTVQRRPRLASGRQRAHGPRSTYLGSETYVALVDGREGPYRSDLRQLAVTVLCTNRNLPLRMPVGEGRTDFVVEAGAPLESAQCIAGPSPPRPSHAWGETTWRLISHLSLNYLSLVDADDGRGAIVLRELLQLYAELTEPAMRRQIEGVRSATGRPIIRRLPLDGPPSFARGVEVTLDCDEAAFEGTSAFLLGIVLDRLFARYVSINSFTETVLRSSQRGEIARWPLRIGRRPNL